VIPMTLSQVADVTGGILHPPEAASVIVDADVVTDSRQARPGSLYIARVGESRDGHDFLAAARDGGAVAALTTRRPPGAPGLPVIVVDDVQAGFAALARAVVDARPDLLVVGITGSSGKTSTKDLLGIVLGHAGPTIAPEGSFNSEVGVPLTVCRVRPDTRFLIVEMGARGIGHVRYLAQMAPPRIGVVLNVGSAHVGEFGSRAAIATAKAELIEALPQDGVAVLNADDPAVRAMAQHTRARVVLVGEAPDAVVRAEDVRVDSGGRPRFTLHTPAGSVPVTLALVGRHHVGNALAVVAVALEAGLALPEIVAALADAGPVSRWRMEVTERVDGVTVVNDAYNANPESMRAALTALADLGAGTADRPPRHTWAVLGTMLELGADADAEHAGVGAAAVAAGIDELVVVGETAAGIAQGASAPGANGIRVHLVGDPQAAAELLEQHLRPGDVVLFKSSRDAGLRWLGELVAAPEGEH